MILTPDDVKKLLVSVFEVVTGLGAGRVIWETEAGPRPPEGLYCSLWWKSFEPLPQNQGDYSDPARNAGASPNGRGALITQHLRNETWCTVQVSFWGPRAFATAAMAVGALQNDNRNFDLWRILGYGGVEAMQDISLPFRGRVQPRCFFDLSFYACFGADYPVDWFDTSQWTIDFADPPATREPEHAVVPEDEPECPHTNLNRRRQRR
jgi:hypothetical protein